jgi:hypothetical protein
VKKEETHEDDQSSLVRRGVFGHAGPSRGPCNSIGCSPDTTGGGRVCGFTLTTKAREELLRAINAAVDGEIAYANARVRADRVKFGNDKIWCRLAFSVYNNLFVPNSNTPW